MEAKQEQACKARDAAVEQARKAFEEALFVAWEAFGRAVDQARRAREEAMLQAWKALE